jgi:hypothetical protein
VTKLRLCQKKRCEVHHDFAAFFNPATARAPSIHPRALQLVESTEEVRLTRSRTSSLFTHLARNRKFPNSCAIRTRMVVWESEISVCRPKGCANFREKDAPAAAIWNCLN